MNPDELLFFRIDDYLRGRLAPEERVAFESDMAADAALAALVRRQKQENQALELLAERDLRTRMNAWERQAPPVMAPVRGGRLNWVRWAAAAMVVLAAGWWLLQRTTPEEAPVAVQPPAPVEAPKTKTKPTPAPARPQRRPNTRPQKDVIADAPQQPAAAPKPAPAPAKKTIDYAALADEYYKERDFFPGAGAGATGTADYERALRDFRSGRYSDLLPQLRPGGKLASKDVKIKELLAHSLLKSRQYESANTAFREIANTRKQPYADRAEWALALSYLRQMPARSGALDQLLRKITARPGHAFYAKAKALQARVAAR